MRRYILCHFLEIIASNEECLSLSCDDVLDLIKADALNTKSEVPIWEFCQKWIAFDEENRLQILPSLLRSIRIGLLHQNVNIKNVFRHVFSSSTE